MASQFVDFQRQLRLLNRVTFSRHLRDIGRVDLSDDACLIHDHLKKLVDTVDVLAGEYAESDSLDWIQWRLNRRRRTPDLEPNDGPLTPPRTPDGGRATSYVKQLESENKVLKEKLEKESTQLLECKESLDVANQTIDNRDSELDSADITIENLKASLAVEFAKTKRFSQAAQLYGELKNVKGSEKTRKQQQSRRAATDAAAQAASKAASAAEKAELTYQYELGEVLLEDGQLTKAEDEIRVVLRDWKDAFDDQDIEMPKRHETQLLLCKILRMQNVADKSNEAEVLYERASPLGVIKSDPIESKRIWALQNRLELACMYAEERYYVDAIKELKEVWTYRARASEAFRKTLTAETLELFNMFEDSDKGEHAVSVLELLSSDSGTLLPEVVSALAKQGLRLHKDHKHERAAVYLRRAWADRPNVQTRPELGWALALSLCQSMPSKRTDAELTEADLVLDALKKMDRSKKGPSDMEIKGLLAHIQLSLKKFTDAEKTAKAVYQYQKDHKSDDFVSLPHLFNPANTLIRAKCGQNTKDKLLEAKAVWSQIYKTREDRELDEDRKILLKLHAAAGSDLADALIKRATAKRSRSEAAPGILKEVKVLEQLAR